MYVDDLHDVIVCGGVEIRGLKASAIPRKKPAGDPVLEEYKFVPFTDKAETSLPEIIRLSTHICLENYSGIKVRTVELIEEADQVSFANVLSTWISEALGDMPLIQADITILSTKKKFEDGTLPQNVSIVDPKKLSADGNALLAIGHRLLTKERADKLDALLPELRCGGFVLTREDVSDTKNVEDLAQNKGFDVILEKKYGSEAFILLKKREKLRERTLVIHVSNEKFDWVEKMRKTMTEELEKETAKNTKIIFVGQGDFENGIFSLSI